MTTRVTTALLDPSAQPRVIQVVNSQTGAVATGTATIPLDDTIPQITEGTEFMTATITPTSASNLLRVDVMANISGAPGGTGNMIAALFRDSGADAVCAQVRFLAGNGFHNCFAFTYYVTAGSTSATTFRLRAGLATAGTTTFNGASGSRQLGGVFLSSITITEIRA